MLEPDVRQIKVNGLSVTIDDTLGKLMVEHDGTITWDQLQAVKNAVWGADARAIEVYPVQAAVVNSGNYRHLWRLGPADFCPDLLEFSFPKPFGRHTGLLARCAAAWRRDVS